MKYRELLCPGSDADHATRINGLCRVDLSERLTQVTRAGADMAVLGAGAIGSVVAAHLARAGVDVALIARGGRARQVASQGVEIAGLAQFQTPIAVIENPAALGEVGVLIVAVKAVGTPAALKSLRGTRVRAALSLQNGIQKNQILRRAFPQAEILGAVANISAECRPAGAVQFTGNHGIDLGSLSSPSSRCAGAVTQALAGSGIRALAVNDIVDREWSKFASWAGLAALSITTRAKTWQFLVDNAAAKLLAQVIREIERLAASQGASLIDLAPIPVATIAAQSDKDSVRTIQTVGRRLRVNAPAHRVSMLQDLERGRAMEIEETFGYALGIAEQQNICVPVLRTVYLLASAIATTSHGLADRAEGR